MSGEFDATERIAGFSLVAIKGALAFVGLLDDRDDIARVAESLHCHWPQALRVLEALEERGFVVRTARREQWNMTDLGRRLSYHWNPPRKCHPAIERGRERGVYGQVFKSVPCYILQAASDDEDMFEEAEIEVGVTASYDNDRLVEISVLQPDDQEEPDGGGTFAISTYVSIADAKSFAEGLTKAIAKAEREVERRKKMSTRQAERAKNDRLKGRKERKSYAGEWATKSDSEKRKEEKRAVAPPSKPVLNAPLRLPAAPKKTNANRSSRVPTTPVASAQGEKW